MLEQMHKHMKWIMWAIVVLITVTFLFFGIYPSSTSGSTVAKVDGYVITGEDLNRVYQNMAENYRRVLKDQFNENFAQVLRKQALQELIQNRLLVQEAERKGLKVSDEELQALSCRSRPSVNQGKFDQRPMKRAPEHQYDPGGVRGNQREFLLRQKLERLVEDGVAVTDAELAAAYAARNPKAKEGISRRTRSLSSRPSWQKKRSEARDVYVRGLESKGKVVLNDKALAGTIRSLLPCSDCRSFLYERIS